MPENKSIRLKAAGLALAVLAPAALIAAWLRRRRPGLASHARPEALGAAAQPAPRQTAPAVAETRSWLALLADEIRSDKAKTRQVAVAAIGVLITTWLGYAYARTIRVEGWQLWVWAACVIAVVAALMPRSRPALRIDKTWIVLLAVSLAALLLRATSLETVPGGLHVDELGVAGFALRHVYPPGGGGTHNPFITASVSQPALFHYLIRLSLTLAGNSITGLRISSAIAGALAVCATYAVVAVLRDRRTALLGAALMAAYHYHVHWSRLGLNNIWDTLWAPLMLAAFAWGWRQRWSGGAVLAGIAVGLSQYFYAGGRIGLLLLALLIFQLWRRDRDRQRLIVHTGKLLATAAVIAAPLAMFALRDPDNFFLRAREVYGWTPAEIRLVTGDPSRVGDFFWHQLTRSIGAYTAFPDTTGFYGPGVPLLIGLAAPLFVLGGAWSIYKRQFMPVVWVLLTALLGGFLLASAPGSSHYVVSIPAICWLVATPLSALIETRRRRLIALGLIGLSIIVVTDLYFYFGVYVPRGPVDLRFPFTP